MSFYSQKGTCIVGGHEWLRGVHGLEVACMAGGGGACVAGDVHGWRHAWLRACMTRGHVW